MRTIGFVLLLAAGLVGVRLFAQQSIQHIDTKELGRLIADHVDFKLIDVREDDEWAKGHAAGAQHIARGTIEAKIEGAAPKKDARIVLYCAHGRRSALAAETLQKMGYTNVWSLDGGFVAYQEAGLPTE